MVIASTISLDQVPGEQFLVASLQKQVMFSLNGKMVKKGRLILFRRIHFFVQIALLTDKNQRENFEIPIPFKVENYQEEGLLYFDYRLDSLETDELPNIPDKVPSVYFNKILEIQTV